MYSQEKLQGMVQGQDGGIKEAVPIDCVWRRMDPRLWFQGLEGQEVDVAATGHVDHCPLHLPPPTGRQRS